MFRWPSMESNFVRRGARGEVGDPLRGRKIMKIGDLFWLAARLGDRFGAWEVGGSLGLIEIYIFTYSNLDFDPIWAILIKYFYIFGIHPYWMFIS